VLTFMFFSGYKIYTTMGTKYKQRITKDLII
jgi:hypothetical protein